MTDKEIKNWKVGDLVISRMSGSVGCGFIYSINEWADGWITIQWARGNRENWADGIASRRNLKLIARLG